MSRGGDRRPIDRSHGRDLSYAYLLLNAMCEDASEAGRRFNRDEKPYSFDGNASSEFSPITMVIN